ncbi:MAG TPA: cytochrome c oxidase subunit 3 [Steroidobacteraceae bacterium]|nr:cytochrome c oxidase subunit 3 [Steroidobacteraceae bacterium]
MSLAVAFGALLAGVVVWGLLARRLTAKPWETPGSPEDLAAGSAVSLPPAKIGLWILLAVITSLFGLFISAYWMRMEHAHGDWTPLAVPRLLWLNTALLILSSAGMQWARGAARRAQADRVRVALIAAGVLALAFLAGQLVAWRQLSASGYFMANSPAIAFFYLLTGVHGLHLLGGLFVWGKTVVRMAQAGVELLDVALSVELCTVYWHYLLLVWLVLFALLLST